MSDHEGWQQHDHEALAHTHRHYHVTHNWNGGSFDHLSAEHEHEHDHSAMRHEHHAHVDFDSEHGTEAHIHDHAEALRYVEPLRPEDSGEKTATGEPVAKETAAPKVGTEAGRRVGKVSKARKGEGQTTRARRTTKASG